MIERPDDEPQAIEPEHEAEHDGSVSDGSVDDAAEPVPTRRDAAGQARDAMDRARQSAKLRGAAKTSPRRARREAYERRDSTAPFEAGREPMSMSASVEAMLRRMGWTETVEVAAVTARWREVIGDQIADHCEPVSFEEGVLTLRASSTAWATQLTLMAGQVRHRINEEFGREVVRELKVTGPISRSWTRGQRSVKGRGPRDTYG